MGKMKKNGDVKYKCKLGSHKLPRTTIIANMGSAKDCPSRALGLCKCASKCYAMQPEVTWPGVLPARREQDRVYHSLDAQTIASEIKMQTTRNTNAFRYNESGDFGSQEDVDKLDEISANLKRDGIVTYGYTARSDLNFDNVSFIVRGSGFKAKDGMTIVVKDKASVPKGYYICPCDCKRCHVCKSTKVKNIAFLEH